MDADKFQPKTLLQLSLIQACIHVSLAWIHGDAKEQLPKPLRSLMLFNWSKILKKYLTETPRWMLMMENERIDFNSEKSLATQTMVFIRYWRRDNISYCPFVPERCVILFSYVHAQLSYVYRGDGELAYLNTKLCNNCFYGDEVIKSHGRFVCCFKYITKPQDKLLLIRNMGNYCSFCRSTPLFTILDADVSEQVDYYIDVPTQRRRITGDEYGLLESFKGIFNPLNICRQEPIDGWTSKAVKYLSAPNNWSDSE